MAEARTAVLAAARTVRDTLATLELEWEEPAPGRFVVVLPGEARLRTSCRLEVGAHSMAVRAFLARAPDEAQEEVYRWLLERNAHGGVVAFALDTVGDVWLVGRVPLPGVTAEVVDGVLGEVLASADGSFNAILERGFASAVRREWVWRESRGESTANLEAFRRLRPG